jgi:putative inorganic carbon (hco3(-)) transporter
VENTVSIIGALHWPARYLRAPTRLTIAILGDSPVTLALPIVLWPIWSYPWVLPWLTLLSLPSVPVWWLARLRLGRTNTAGIGVPATWFLITLCLSAVVVRDWSTAVPKLLGLILGVVTALTVARVCEAGWLVWILAVLRPVALVVGIAFVLLLSLTNTKLPWVRLIIGSAEGPINPTEVGGVLSLLVPLVAGLVLLRAEPGARRPERMDWGWPALIVLVIADILTRSRAAYAGATLGVLLVLGGWTWTSIHAAIGIKHRVAVGALWIVTCAICMLVGAQALMMWISLGEPPYSMDSFGSRLELWQRSWLMLQDFSITGIGPGQFDLVLWTLYPPYLVRPTGPSTHAHNVVLDVAVQLGIPALVAFGGLIAISVRRLVRTCATPGAHVAGPALGVLGALVGYFGFGLTDAIAPGARAGIALWIVLGIAAGFPAKPVGDDAQSPAQRVAGYEYNLNSRGRSV